MNFKIINNNDLEVTSLFISVFSSSEGKKEGALIGNLTSELFSSIDSQDIICIAAYEEEIIIGAIFFTRLQFISDIKVYMLAPVAVATSHQGKGVGQALINYGLNELKKRSVSAAVTYGDPSFYSKVGFLPLSENIIMAPLKLSMPEGWLGKPLLKETIVPMIDRPTCVKAFNDPALW